MTYWIIEWCRDEISGCFKCENEETIFIYGVLHYIYIYVYMCRRVVDVVQQFARDSLHHI